MLGAGVGMGGVITSTSRPEESGPSSADLIDRTTGEGPGLVEAAVRWARDVANYPETVWDWITN